MQNISVLDLLKQGKIYRADYNKIFDKDYLRQYKFLAHQAGFEDCPIFCATQKSKSIISSSGLHKSKSNVLLTLNVPDDETYCTEYYTWTDYLYFSTEDTNHSYIIGTYGSKHDKDINYKKAMIDKFIDKYADDTVIKSDTVDGTCLWVVASKKLLKKK